MKRIAAELMDKDHVLAILQQHAPELREAGLLHLRLFGSVARGEATEESDIDLLVDFDRSRQITLLTISRLEQRLATLLHARVDLSASAWMREAVRSQALAEAVVAF